MPKKYIKEIYNRAIEIHNEEDNFVKFLKLLKSFECNSVLDVGCGYGRKLEVLSSYGFDALGVDINKDIIKNNCERGLKCVTVDDFLNNPSKYDVLIMSHIIEHFQPQELKKFLDNYLEFLKPNGFLIIATPLESPYFYDDFDHIKPYHPTGIQMVFGGEGAQVQYYSKHKLVLVDLWFRRSPFRSVMVKRQHIANGAKWFLLIDFLYAVLFRVSFGYIGRKDGWMGLFQKIS